MKLSMPELFMYLLDKKNFYGYVANQLARVPVPGIGQMYVGVSDGRLKLFYDPEFVAKASLAMGLFVLEHEMVHVAMDHIPRYLEMLSRYAQDPGMRVRVEAVQQVAADCAVNGLLRKNDYFPKAQKDMVGWLLETGAEVTPGESIILPEHHDLPLSGSFESYTHDLMERCVDVPMPPPDVTGDGDGDEENDADGEGAESDSSQAAAGEGAPSGEPSKAPGQSPLDKVIRDFKDKVKNTHSKWSESPNGGNGEEGSEHLTSDEMKGLADKLRSQLKQVLRNAVDQAKKDRGLIPGGVSEFLVGYLADPIVPWWELLTSRVKASKRSKKDRGIQRPNRMLLGMSEEDAAIIPAIGSTRDPRFRVFFMTDKSGSMSTEELKIALSELTHLLRADEDMEVRYMQGDAEVKFDKVYKTGEELPKEMIGRGGTCFDSYFEYMGKYMGNDDTEPDIVIVYTDAGAPAIRHDHRLPTHVPVIWLVTHANAAGHLLMDGYGEVIYCNPGHKAVL